MPAMLTELEREKLQRVHRHKNKYSKCEFDVYQVEKQDKFILQFCCMKEKQLGWYRNEERMLLLRCSLITKIYKPTFFAYSRIGRHEGGAQFF